MVKKQIFIMFTQKFILIIIIQLLFLFCIAFLIGNQVLFLDFNIIVVEWGALASPRPAILSSVLYTQTTTNVPIVARRLSDFILFLRNNSMIALNNTYLIGHSLGAHVVGLAGRNVFLQTNQRIARITGLDPAGPGFFPPTATRNLRSDNALFVDVIHSDRGGFGDITNDGHVDFYRKG